MPLESLRRFTGSRPAALPGERCELCSEPVPEDHPHVADVETRGLLCACRACHLLFTQEGAARGRYRAVPDRYLHGPRFVLSDAQWEAPQIPVGMAFFFHNSAVDEVVAFYPSPAGATESLLPLEEWRNLMSANPLLETLAPDVEALLVYRPGGARPSGPFACCLVPIDSCYELVGVIRRTWKGFDGGQEAWAAIDAYFQRIQARARTVA